MVFKTHLQAHWRFDTDATDNFSSNDMTVSGATHVSSGGKIKGYYSLDGDNDCLYRNDDADLETTGDWTWNIWAYVIEPGAEFVGLIAKENPANNHTTTPYNIYIENRGGAYEEDSLRMHMGNNNSDYWVTGWSSFFVGYYSTWVMITIKISGTTVSAYRNGSSFGSSGTYSGTRVTNSAPTYFGFYNYSGSTAYYYGYMDEASFWKRALTDNEITALYNSGSGRSLPFVKTNGVYAQKINGVSVGNIKKIGGVEW